MPPVRLGGGIGESPLANIGSKQPFIAKKFDPVAEDFKKPTPRPNSIIGHPDPQKNW